MTGLHTAVRAPLGPRWAVVPDAALATASLAGAAGLIGGGIDLGARVTDRLPFDSPVLAGTALFLLVAVPAAAAAGAGARGHRATGDLTLIAGVLLVGWILVQLVVIATFSWLQVVCVLYGLGLIALARRIRPPRGPR